MKTHLSLFMALWLWSSAFANPVSETRPAVSVSPGGIEGPTWLTDPCPTFSWGSVPGAVGYELAVFQAQDDSALSYEVQAALGEPVLEARILAPGLAWPAIDGGCLQDGWGYFWYVRALYQPGAGPWSEARHFEIDVSGDFVLGTESLDSALPQAIPGPPYLLSVGGNALVEGVLEVGTSGVPAPILNVADPTNPQDAATKAYVDANSGGGGGGDITSVTAGTGLTGGGTTGAVSLNADTTFLQRRVSGCLGVGTAMTFIDESGIPTCVDVSFGDHTADGTVNLNGHWLSGDSGPRGLFVATAGYVGIGTSTPVTQLHVKGYGITTERAGGPFVRFNDTNAGTDTWLFQANSPAVGAFRIRNETDNADRLVIDTNGYVGIGTSTPTTQLHVVGYGITTERAGGPFVRFSDSTVGANTWVLQGNSPSAGEFRIRDETTARDYLVVNGGGYGITVNGGIGGAQILNAVGSGSASLAVLDTGISAFGSTTAGLFQNGSGAIAYLATDDSSFGWSTGIETYGPIEGGIFRSPGGLAYVADNLYGVVSEAQIAGGDFRNTTTGSTGTVGYRTYKIFGTGQVSFVQNHPEEPEQVIVYSAPEGDEVATYTRGTARLVGGDAVVSLGETFKWVTNPDIGLTAHLTAKGGWSALYVDSLTTETLVVKSAPGFPDDVAFDYIVYGLRVGFEETAIVQDKTREALIPAMTPHETTYRMHPEMRRHNALERFGEMRQKMGKAAMPDLVDANALREAIGVFDPAVDQIPKRYPNRPVSGDATRQDGAPTH